MTRILIQHKASTGQEVTIHGDELHYLVNVRRKRVGEKVEVQDPCGAIFEATVRSVEKKCAVVCLDTGLAPANRPHDVRVITAVPKGRILDDIVRNLSELGVERIVPVACERSVANPGDGKHNRWQKIADESIRQCRRSVPLIVENTLPLEQALREAPPGRRFFMHPGTGGHAGEIFSARGNGPLTIAIGPEGGFTNAEVEMAGALGFEGVRFGNLILRIETAIIAASVASVAYVGGFDS